MSHTAPVQLESGNPYYCALPVGEVRRLSSFKLCDEHVLRTLKTAVPACLGPEYLPSVLHDCENIWGRAEIGAGDFE